MRYKCKYKGLHTLTKSGSLIFCDTCEKIVGSINRQGYRYINLNIICTCDNCGSLELVKPESTANIEEHIEHMPLEKFGLAVCKKCGEPIFGIIDDRVVNYSFYVECACGEKYDTRPNSGVRLGETVKILNNK